MKSKLMFVMVIAMSAALAQAQTCADNAVEVRPQLRDEVRKEFEKKLDDARKDMIAMPTADNAIWYARRKGYLGLYKEAVKDLTFNIGRFPKDARLYRHRGHRYITLRCFDDAVKDLESAAKLIKGKEDEVEPDGLPNPLNIPTSTLQSNIWYHLGLAYYLKADWKNALRAYAKLKKSRKIRICSLPLRIGSI